MLCNNVFDAFPKILFNDFELVLTNPSSLPHHVLKDGKAMRAHHEVSVFSFFEAARPPKIVDTKLFLRLATLTFSAFSSMGDMGGASSALVGGVTSFAAGGLNDENDCSWSAKHLFIAVLKITDLDTKPLGPVRPGSSRRCRSVLVNCRHPVIRLIHRLCKRLPVEGHILLL